MEHKISSELAAKLARFYGERAELLFKSPLITRIEDVRECKLGETVAYIDINNTIISRVVDSKIANLVFAILRPKKTQMIQRIIFTSTGRIEKPREPYWFQDCNGWFIPASNHNPLNYTKTSTYIRYVDDMEVEIEE